MNKFLRTIVIVLLFRVDWKKLLFVGAIITATGVFLQTSTLPHSPTKRNLVPPTDKSSYYKTLNSALRLAPISPVTKDEHFEPIRVSPKVVLDSAPESNVSLLIEHGSTKILSSYMLVNSTLKSNVSLMIEQGRKKNLSSSKMLVNSTQESNISLMIEQGIAKILPSSKRAATSLSLIDISALSPHEALLYAKKWIDGMSNINDDPGPDLYAPIFRNVSFFKRSYEMMELVLKVYIYQEGKRPIFHTPYLRGIYSSEGWFMKLMEQSKKFVTKDPEKAHLFYLPYSARQLQNELYMPNSHNMKPLSIFLRDYVNMLASKYPFWNRTRGSDHFLVACHDWGPYTLTAHEELTKNTIKALCNADISEGIFKSTKDISLPETTIRNPRRPLRDIGGKRVSQRPILAFYAGRMHGRVRPKLLKFWRDKDDDMRIYGPLPNRVSRNMSYPRHMKSSKYCICPMGYEVNSPRIVEAIYYECVPVIIADNFVPPLNEVLDWGAFSVVVAESDIPRLKEILLDIPLRKYLRMQDNVKKLQMHFYWNARPVKYDLFHMILHSIWLSRLNQVQEPSLS